MVTDELLIWMLAEMPDSICNMHHVDIWLNILCKKLLILCQKLYCVVISLISIDVVSFTNTLLESKYTYSLRLYTIIAIKYPKKHIIKTTPLVLKFSTYVFCIIKLLYFLFRLLFK